jgi:hypothetical protein
VFNVPPLLAIYFAAAALGIGSAIGIITIKAVYRRRLDVRLTLRALWSGMVFLLVILVASWADSHVLIRNGTKVVLGSHGENLRLESFMARYGFAIAFASSIVVALLAGLRLGRGAQR